MPHLRRELITVLDPLKYLNFYVINPFLEGLTAPFMDVYCTQRRNARFYPHFHVPCCRKRHHLAHMPLFLLIREALRDTDQVSAAGE